MKKATILTLAIYSALLAGCIATDPITGFIAEMDAMPPEKQLPNWSTTRALMMRKPPEVGDTAPDFTLKARAGDTTTTLSQFKNDRPVVLIFGSWT